MRRAARMTLLVGGACAVILGLVSLFVTLGGTWLADIIANWPRPSAHGDFGWGAVFVVWMALFMRPKSTAPNIDSMRSVVEREFRRATEKIEMLASDIRDTGSLRDRVALTILNELIRNSELTVVSMRMLATEAYAKADVVMQVRRSRS